MLEPDSMKQESPLFYDNMYGGKEPGPASWVQLPRLLAVRGVMGCRSTHNSAHGAYAPATRARPRQRAPAALADRDSLCGVTIRQPPLAPPALADLDPRQHQLQGLVVFDSSGRQFTLSSPAEPKPLALTDIDRARAPEAADIRAPTAASPTTATCATAGAASGGTEAPTAADAATPAGAAPAATPKAKVLSHLDKMKQLAKGGAPDEAPAADQADSATDQTQDKGSKSKAQGNGCKKFGGTKKAQKHLAKAAAEAPPTPTATKRPAANISAESAEKPLTKKTKQAAPTTAAQKGDKALAFPGEKKRAPLVYGKSVVYFSPGRYRLMKTKGDRLDVAFSHKLQGARVAWHNVCVELRKLNPNV